MVCQEKFFSEVICFSGSQKNGKKNDKKNDKKNGGGGPKNLLFLIILWYIGGKIRGVREYGHP